MPFCIDSTQKEALKNEWLFKSVAYTILEYKILWIQIQYANFQACYRKENVTVEFYIPN